ncbi:MAG: aromatic acid exporter family protein [Myxococcota bacterium]|nr:aromatic acid exporter family protein [Myxococcota bacterium]
MSTSLSHPLYIAAKAAIAALLALVLVEAGGIEDRLSACFVAVVCTSPTVYSGFRRGLGQLLGSAIGGSITLLLAFWAPRSVTLVAALFITIWVSFLLRVGSDYVVAAFTVLYVLLIPGDATHTLEHRLASVAIGVLSATVLNLLVSFARRRRVFARRLDIARLLVASELERAATVLEQGPGPRLGEAHARGQLFEAPFRLLRVLSDELSDAARELGASARWRAQVQGACRATQQLLAVSHYGKDLLLSFEDSPRARPLSAAAASELATAMRQQRPARLGEIQDEVGGRSLRAAADAWTRALAGLRDFATLPREESTGSSAAAGPRS